MRKFLLALCLLWSGFAVAADLPLIVSVNALRAPVEEIVSEAAKGRASDFALLAKSCAAADQAWKQGMTEPVDLDRYGIPAVQHEATWRQIRLLGMVVGYLDEGAKRGDLALVLRAAGMLKSAHENLAASLGQR